MYSITNIKIIKIHVGKQQQIPSGTFLEIYFFTPQDMKLRTHAYYIISMTTEQRQIALFSFNTAETCYQTWY
jgi:hypothetical protein